VSPKTIAPKRARGAMPSIARHGGALSAIGARRGVWLHAPVIALRALPSAMPAAVSPAGITTPDWAGVLAACAPAWRCGCATAARIKLQEFR
jgi:hypothetical protein